MATAAKADQNIWKLHVFYELKSPLIFWKRHKGELLIAIYWSMRIVHCQTSQNGHISTN